MKIQLILIFSSHEERISPSLRASILKIKITAVDHRLAISSSSSKCSADNRNSFDAETCGPRQREIYNRSNRSRSMQGRSTESGARPLSKLSIAWTTMLETFSVATRREYLSCRSRLLISSKREKRTEGTGRKERKEGPSLRSTLVRECY